jgi:lipoprotein LprG
VCEAEDVLRRDRPTPLAAALVTVLVLVLPVLAACSGSGGGGGSSASPEQVLATAKRNLDRTSGVDITLHTDDLAPGVTGVEDATGVGTHAPAFDGKITVVLSGQAFQVPVIAVGGKVHVQLPLTNGWQVIDPSDYGAPDPAQLMSTDHGFSSLLTASTGVKKGGSVRGGANNKEVLTKYTATVSSAAVAHVIPTASGSFAATYTVTDSGELREATLTGVFYKKAPRMTYTVTFEGYGTQKDITAP